MNKTPFYRQTWVEIDLKALAFNYRLLRRTLSPATKIMAPVKANAYGHGIVEISRKLVASGVEYLGVACVDEAIVLRQNRLSCPILNLGTFSKRDLRAILDFDVTITVSDLSLMESLNRLAGKEKKKVLVHAKIDTGMGRLGVWYKDSIDFIHQLCSFKNITLEGIYTHFPSADMDEDFTQSQIAVFSTLITNLMHKCIVIPLRHAANSMAVIGFAGAHFNLVRPGLALYGLHPKDELLGKIALKPVMSFKTRVSFLKEIGPGRSVSYGRTYVAHRRTKIATLPVGYGDGYNRLLSNKGKVLIGGKFCPVRGVVCMDQMMVEAGLRSRVRLDDEVVLIGQQKKNIIRVEDIARACHTIPYEVVCWISPRVPRVYLD